MIGLKKGSVALLSHEKEWENEAEKTKTLLQSILGDAAYRIEHIGSTAVPSIKAKPIIDIAVSAKKLSDITDKQKELERAGFYRRSDSKGQLLFACGSLYDGTGDVQTHFIHIVPKDSMEWINYINFRDYLRKTPEIAKEYEKLKISLAGKYSDREKYTAGKNDFITYTLRKALVRSYLGKEIKIEIDRPVGYIHKKEKYSLIYPINYGYIPGVIGGDGEELDVYLLGVNTPVKEYTAKVIGIVHRENDVEDKLVCAPENASFTKKEIENAVHFQEQYYKTEIETEKNT